MSLALGTAQRARGEVSREKGIFSRLALKAFLRSQNKNNFFQTIIRNNNNLARSILALEVVLEYSHTYMYWSNLIFFLTRFFV